jgi:hypothetical protein
MKVDHIIALCCKQDAKTWSFANKAIIKFIPAKRYTLIVPDAELELFNEITSRQFHIEPESKYTTYFEELLLKKLPEEGGSQSRWYLQQFIKLEILNQLETNQVAVLWDGDTIPLQPIHFFDGSGKLQYFVGSENHLPYFQTIHNLLNIDRQILYSFISQSFPIRTQWFQEFKKVIESRFGKPWFEAILNSINFSQSNAFSEYETLGNFIAKNHSNEICFTHEPWLRLGNSVIGDVSLINSSTAQQKLSQYQYVSFEKWDRAKPYFLKVVLPFFIHTFIFPSLNKALTWKLIRTLYYKFLQSQGILKINSGVGMFSCCTARLQEILTYFNTNHTLPKIVDSREQFSRYKDHNGHDVSADLFSTSDQVQIYWAGVPIKITDFPNEEQFSIYKDINFEKLKPFIDKYFSPSKIITKAVSNLAKSCQIDLNNTCVIRFRGTDKEEETIQPSYEAMLSKALYIKVKYPTIQFAIQTDDDDFRQFIYKAIGENCFEVENTNWTGWTGNIGYIDFYASILLLSKSKCIITTSGNGELWMILFRGNVEGVVQYLQHKEIIYGKHNPSFVQGQTNFWVE